MLDEEKKHIEKAKNGDQEAFGLLYDHYLPKIYRFVFLKTNNRAEAQDLTHEVFLSAWKNIPSYQYQGLPFSSWLYQIARNAVIDFYRTKKQTVPVELVNENTFEVATIEPARIDMELEMEKIQKAIQLLRPEYQDVLIMRFIEDLPHEEVAAILNKSEGAVRLIQHRALKELKSIYENGKVNPTTPEV